MDNCGKMTFQSGLLIVSITLIGSVVSIDVAGQLAVIKNDCYERLAIGEKLSPKQTYKTFDHNTVSKCEMECTQEKETCRAFSFGIGPKGNGTCLLSKMAVKETADLKPIGTIRDTDFDLYIKKMDCKIVIEPPSFVGAEKPPDELHIYSTKPLNVGQEQHEHHHHDHENLPAEGDPYAQPSSPNLYSSLKHPYQGYGNGYQYNKPHTPLSPPSNHQGDKVEHVQALVSIASGPQSVLHPVHNILISGDSYEPGSSQGSPIASTYGDGNLPPYRPPALHHPYDDCRPQERPFNGYDKPSRPLPNYGSAKPDYFQPDNGYNYPKPDKNRPGYTKPETGYGQPVRPQLEYGNPKPDNFKPVTGYDYPKPDYYKPDVGYEFQKPGLRPESDFLNYRPYLPYPSDYGTPQNIPGPSYLPPSDDRPDPNTPNSGYSGGFLAIDRRKYQSYNQFDSFESETSGYYPIRPNNPDFNYYDNYDRPDPARPNRYGSVIPHPSDYLFLRPNPDNYDPPPLKPLPTGGYNSNDKPRPPNNYYNQNSDRNDQNLGYNDRNTNQGYEKPLPSWPSRPSQDNPIAPRPIKPVTEINGYDGVDYTNKHYGKPGEYQDDKNEGGKKVISHSIGHHGEKITAIITEINNACFRRTLAGKRVVRSLVRKLLFCDTVEQCQWECGDERRFTCEGFNYRLDPSGRGKGECELLALSLPQIDVVREIVTDPDYDYYTRDRNAAQVNCGQRPSNSLFSVYGDRRHGYYGNRRDRRPTDIARPLRPPGERWDYGTQPTRPRPLPPIDQRPLPDGERNYEYGNRRGDYSYDHHLHESQSNRFSNHYKEHNLDSFDSHNDGYRPYNGIHYLPASNGWRPSHRHSPPHYEPDSSFRPPNHSFSESKFIPDRTPPDRLPSRDHWGLNNYGWGSYGGHYGNPESYHPHRGTNGHRLSVHRNEVDNRRQYFYSKPEPPSDWGMYGGSYGTGGINLEYKGYGNNQGYNYWGFNKYHDQDYGLLPPRKQIGNYLPPPENSYLPLPKPGHYLPSQPHIRDFDNSILPYKPRRPPPHTLNEECSLRTATGFRLHKKIVKKFFAVPNIYECELLCVKEKDFPCASYAFRYSISLSFPTDNCYLSNRNYKELDYYSDLEPDRDFDIYTMNNKQTCSEPLVILEKKHSECFWRVRSSHRLSDSVVRDSLTVNSIVDCQLECLKSRGFTCRSYSFRYGSPIIGGIIDNCQLTDCPLFELDPKVHFVYEPGFEIYERGSFGHGCEVDHFGIRGRPHIINDGAKIDQICYIGFGSAARLLPQATIKSTHVPTELDCKIECSKGREGTFFRCMSFSFSTGRLIAGQNCFLSDIMQRDLLPNVDYIHDPDSWLFTWDHYNPDCVDFAYKNVHSVQKPNGFTHKYGLDYPNALDVWRAYSVNGWPCKRGTLCKENKEAGFWYCEIEGGNHDPWDYCCSPDHQCGLSKGYPYSWCYVGPTRTQWRKCSDYYYPYIHNVNDRFDQHAPPPSHSPGYRPDRPNAPDKPEKPKPSLDQYEEQFDNQFLKPPKPGGFGEPRRWPVSYLHKENPTNDTETDVESSSNTIPSRKKENTKLAAIKNLIDVIKNNDFKNVQYHIANDSNKSDDVLFVKIPLPNYDEKNASTTTERPKRRNKLVSRTKVNLEVVDGMQDRKSKMQKSLAEQEVNDDSDMDNLTRMPVFRRGFVTRTNLTNIRKNQAEPF
ncbi:uncharacterized protein LOC115889139 isoform X2 [Sitophilus oryzae]|uniref:Uncharacterized protein LOC115889139 isoform X2 n=1 Tax=Sitophilus oryzae TaxID=7048 RepID=A0A6J2YNV3_SITOR|nr:uncharacterized protein LOC115889139 isoform X2 [Sitophilus oryzae]